MSLSNGPRRNMQKETRPVEPDPNEQARSVPVDAELQPRTLITVAPAPQAFARGGITRGRITTIIVNALSFDDEADEAKEKALASYLDQIDHIEVSQRRGRRDTESTSTVSSQEDWKGEQSRSDKGAEVSRGPSPSGASRGYWRPGEEGRGDGYGNGGGSEDEGGESESGEERPRKKRLREETMPWFDNDRRQRQSTNPSCLESARLIRRYGRDLAQVKQWITLSPTAPRGFPLSEWDNLLKGKAVNLDVVFSSMYHIGAVKENRGRIGEHEISFGHSEPSRKVLTYGDWTIAWNLAADAGTFVFPHRRRKFLEYGRFIQGEFTAKQTHAHWKVIRFDQSIRNEVGGATSILLTDFEQFHRHRAAILQSDGYFADHETKTHPPLKARGTAGTAIPVVPAGKEDTEQRLVRGRNEEIRGSAPKYRRFNVWDAHVRLPNTADWTTSAAPLPRPPPEELSNATNCNTISQNPHLFEVSTPINTDLFESLLKDHPNPDFVHSVVAGLREGFWPCGDTNLPGYPSTHDAHIGTTKNVEQAAFLSAQISTEEQKGRFSSPFGPDLLPGMYSMPIYAVPKDNGTTYRMVMNHSAGPFSLNSMIDKDHVSPSPLDNINHLGDGLIRFRKEHPSSHLTMWKADVAEAYRLLPVHPHWQLKQVVTFDGRRRVDRRNTFGNRAAGALWIAFLALVTWIAENVRQIVNLVGAYVDDSFGFDESDEFSWYCPYDKFLPPSQTALLELWDDLGIPHKEKKQVFGSPLIIIGFDVDPNTMSITMPVNAKTEFLHELSIWTAKPRKGSNDRKFKVHQWQKFAGWFNWALNVYPWLRPALNRFYPKLNGEAGPSSKVWSNNAVRYDLAWAREHVLSLPGTRIMANTKWSLTEADITIYVDACLQGMGFWYQDTDVGFYSPVPSELIFYFEALCALSALNHAMSHPHPSTPRVVIFSDSTNTVDMFSSLRAVPTFNHLLLGRDNVIADAISRLNIGAALDLIPGFHLSYFQPPRFPLGAMQK